MKKFFKKINCRIIKKIFGIIIILGFLTFPVLNLVSKVGLVNALLGFVVVLIAALLFIVAVRWLLG